MSGRLPASIRYNNPLAMYPGPAAKKWGTTGTERIGGGHLIAKFDDPIKGAAGNYQLMLDRYVGKTGRDFINTWSGGNSVETYLKSVGVDPSRPITREMLSDPSFAVPLAMRMAGHEAGRPGALSEEQWRQAHGMALGGSPPGPSGADLAAPGAAPANDVTPMQADADMAPFSYAEPEPEPAPPPPRSQAAIPPARNPNTAKLAMALMQRRSPFVRSA